MVTRAVGEDGLNRWWGLKRALMTSPGWCKGFGFRQTQFTSWLCHFQECEQVMSSFVFLFFIFLKIFIYLFICQRERERASTGRQSGRGRSRLPAEQGARCGTRSQDAGIMTWAEGSRLTNWATQESLYSWYYYLRPISPNDWLV